MRHIYANQLFPKLLPHQRVFVVPGLFGDTSLPIGPQDKQLVLKWKGSVSTPAFIEIPDRKDRFLPYGRSKTVQWQYF